MGKVRDLLALGEEGHRVEVLWGKAHLGRQVGSLYVLHRLDEPLRFRPGDLLLVPAETITRGAPGQSWLAGLRTLRPAAVLIHSRSDDPALMARLQPEWDTPGHSCGRLWWASTWSSSMGGACRCPSPCCPRARRGQRW